MKSKVSLSTFEIVLFGALGALMFVSKQVFEFLPNVHMLAMLTVTYTVVYRWKGIFPVIVFVLLEGIMFGFATWWIPYLYLWPLLWLVTLAIPVRISDRAAMIVYPVICGLHGFLYGTLYAPFQALLYRYDFTQMLVWISTGLTWDMIHGCSNIAMGLLVLPASKLLRKLNNQVKST